MGDRRARHLASLFDEQIFRGGQIATATYFIPGSADDEERLTVVLRYREPPPVLVLFDWLLDDEYDQGDAEVLLEELLRSDLAFRYAVDEARVKQVEATLVSFRPEALTEQERIFRGGGS